MSLKSWCVSLQPKRFDWDLVCGSSMSCMVMFFIGCCLTLNLHTLPSVIWPLAVCVPLSLLSLQRVKLRAVVFLLLGFSWACFNFQTFLNTPFPDAYERIDFVALGTIEGLPTTRDENVQFRFRVNAVDDDNLSMLINKRLQLSCYRCTLSIGAGDQWQLTLRAKRPHGYASWGAFDYEKYLFRHQVVAKGYVRLKAHNQRIAVISSSIHIGRQSLLEALRRVVGSGVGGNIIAALTIGVKTGFSNEQKQVFQTTGVSHLMAISGLHVGLVFIGVAFILKWFLWPVARIFEFYPRQQLVLLPALSAAIFYAALAGFAVSTQRALIMLVVYVVCKFLARDVGLIKVLLIAVVVLLLIDPFSILDIGFWLSCGAVAIISLVSSNAKNAHRQGSVSETSTHSQSSTSSNDKLSLFRLQPMLWLGSLPLSVVFFGQVSLISPLINLIAVPLFCMLLIPATLLSTLIFCLGFNTIGAWCLMQLNDVFEFVFKLLEIASQWPGAKIHATALTWWQWLVFILIVLCYRSWLRGSAVLSLLLISSIFAKPSPNFDKDEVGITLLDVGQGLAIVIETANSVTVYDTGPRYGTGFTAASAVLLPFLRYRGIRSVDTLVISHADNDHIGGLETLRDAFPVARTISSRLDKVSDANECFAGQFWQYDQTKFTVISPQVDTPSGSNNLSCVIMMEHYGTKILLSGDIEKQVERFLVRNAKDSLDADILLVPHQGSKTSSTEGFVNAVSPQMAMLAAGYKNHYGHPHPSVVKRYQSKGIELLSTIDDGSILLKVNSQGWSKVLYRQRYMRFWHYQKLPNNRP